MNEVILIISLIITYLSVLVFYKFFGKTGLFVWTAIATVSANIEVLLLVDAFGIEQTLGNILFASTFLVTDILSELEGKKSANKAVKIGIFTSVIFIIISQSWLLYNPSVNDWAYPSFEIIFSNTARTMLAGITVYAIVQTFDVWIYHLIWKKTTNKLGDSKRGLWIRNNGSTLISQLLNSVLFTLAAFLGIYTTDTLISVMFATFAVYFFTSILDTPLVYLARKLKNNGQINEE